MSRRDEMVKSVHVAATIEHAPGGWYVVVPMSSGVRRKFFGRTAKEACNAAAFHLSDDARQANERVRGEM